MSSDTLIPVSIDFINGDILYFFTFDTDTDFSSSTIVSDGIILTPFIELINCLKTEIIFLSSKAIVIVSIVISFFFIITVQRYVLFLKPPKERGENNDYLIIGAGLHKVKTLEKAQAADGGSYGPPCMQLFFK